MKANKPEKKKTILKGPGLSLEVIPASACEEDAVARCGRGSGRLASCVAVCGHLLELVKRLLMNF